MQGMMTAKDRERASTRNAIVNGCAKLLPEVQQQLIFEPAVLPRKMNRGKCFADIILLQELLSKSLQETNLQLSLFLFSLLYFFDGFFQMRILFFIFLVIKENLTLILILPTREIYDFSQ